MFTATVGKGIFLGSHVEYRLSAGGERLLLRSMDDDVLKAGGDVSISVDPALTRIFPAD